MEITNIPVDRLSVKINHLWSKQWLLLTCGDFARSHYNAMTVAWGSMGVMWNKPFVQLVVRPTRYTYGFMEQYNTFSLCAFPPKFKDALEILGTKSGRDGDKIAETFLTPIPAQKIAAPCFAEAELIVECRKIYWDDFKPSQFLDTAIKSNYPQKDYHRIYFGEIVDLRGVETYLA